MEAELRKENEELKRQLAHTEADRDRYLCRCQELEQRLAEVEPPDQMITTEAQTVEATSSESDLPTGFRVLKKSNNKRKEIAPGESVAPKRSKPQGNETAKAIQERIKDLDEFKQDNLRQFVRKKSDDSNDFNFDCLIDGCPIGGYCANGQTKIINHLLAHHRSIINELLPEDEDPVFDPINGYPFKVGDETVLIKHNGQAYVCECNYATELNINMLNHLKAHLDQFDYFCLNCAYFTSFEPIFTRHSKSCMPSLTNQRRNKETKFGNDKNLLHSDIQTIVSSIHTNNTASDDILQSLGTAKIELLKRLFPLFFDVPFFKNPTLFAEFQLAYTNAQRRTVLSAPNYGTLYLLAEFPQLKPDSNTLPHNSRYIGSSVDIQDRLFVHNRSLFKNSKTYNQKREDAEKMGRKFEFIIIANEINENERHCFEDALKRYCECLSNERWNVIAINRKQGCVTYNWPLEKIIAFGQFLVQTNWPSIQEQIGEKHSKLWPENGQMNL